MDIILLLKFLAGLSGVLGILILLHFYLSHAKKSQKKKSTEKLLQIHEVKPELNTLLEVIKDKKSTAEELKEAVDLILKYYGEIPKKLGICIHPKFEIYSELMLQICHHPNTTKEVILKLDKELARLNPEYKIELEDLLTKGLDTRGIFA